MRVCTGVGGDQVGVAGRRRADGRGGGGAPTAEGRRRAAAGGMDGAEGRGGEEVEARQPRGVVGEGQYVLIRTGPVHAVSRTHITHTSTDTNVQL